MPAPSARPQPAVPIFPRIVLLLAVAMLLGGCVAQVRVAPPLPPPPPPAYVAADAGAVIQVQVVPPPLPIYEQPPCPGPSYLWIPGYWAYSGGYYWVPGTWVLPPRIGVLWTPGYWGFVGGAYVWHVGYWGPHVGFYGGVHYGFGYFGAGFVGGRWVGNAFAYNRFVTNVNVTVVRNTYVQTVNRSVVVNRASFNGPGGIAAAPTRDEQLAQRETHFPSTPAQQEHIREAARNPALFAKANGGRPPIAATARPAVFSGPGVVAARGAVSAGRQSARANNRERAQFAGQRRAARARARARRQQARRGKQQRRRAARRHAKRKPPKKKAEAKAAEH